MSLRSFHIVFIVVSLALLAFLAAWSGSRALDGARGFEPVLALLSAGGLAAGLPYLRWFLGKEAAGAAR